MAQQPPTPPPAPTTKHTMKAGTAANSQPLEVNIKRAAVPERLCLNPGHRQVPHTAVGGNASCLAGADEQARQLDDRARGSHHRRHGPRRLGTGQAR